MRLTAPVMRRSLRAARVRTGATALPRTTTLCLVAWTSPFSTSSDSQESGQSPTELPRVVDQETVFENPWIRLKTIRFLDQKGAERKWTGLERTTTYPQLSRPATNTNANTKTKSKTNTNTNAEANVNANEKCDAVVVFPFLTRANAPTEVILIRQFRPPVGKWVIELPAGLIDGNEAPAAAAMRELAEETGYVASRVLHMGPPMVNDQGLTNGTCRLLLVHVRFEDQPSNPIQHLEDDEMIEVLRTPINGLIPWLHSRRRTHDDAIDARLYSYALGLEALPTMLQVDQTEDADGMK